MAENDFFYFLISTQNVNKVIMTILGESVTPTSLHGWERTTVLHEVPENECATTGLPNEGQDIPYRLFLRRLCAG